MADENNPTLPTGIEPAPSLTPSGVAPGPTNAAATPATTPVQTTLPEITKTKKAAAKRKTRKATAKFKPTAADALLLRAVQSGQSTGQFAAAHNLDLDTLERRVNTLVRQKFLVRNDANPQYLHLGLAGLEHLTKLDEKKNKSNRKTTAQAVNAPIVPTLSAPSPRHEPDTPVEINPALSPSGGATLGPTRATQHHVTEYEEEERDLIEVMQEERKKAEANGSLKGKKSPAANSKALAHLPFNTPNPIARGLPAPTAPVQPSAVLPTASASDGSCEVCKSPFKTSVREPQLAKFANCVCGAPFHQDCYDGTIDTGDGKCPRCARTLKPILGKSANDALSDIKDAFE